MLQISDRGKMDIERGQREATERRKERKKERKRPKKQLKVYLPSLSISSLLHTHTHTRAQICADYAIC
jgi:hypothetical protein